jgi:hypothetical protein
MYRRYCTGRRVRLPNLRVTMLSHFVDGSRSGLIMPPGLLALADEVIE